ncbi:MULTISPECIES: hypothetical protein [Acidiphilium]|uniref:hypothetical protein n=1 Tax=Acidiphilium TaxID=522 RepID=UPI0004941C0D|nr:MULTISPECIES: hypothetical protein [Acidiphilium]
MGALWPFGESKARQGKHFFFEKKKQKTFWRLVRGGLTRVDSVTGVFLLLFFQKKKSSLLLPYLAF